MQRAYPGVLAGALFASLSSISLAVDFGRTSGSFGVSPSGAATYSIPIWTPPGPNGLTPSISISYDSQAENGLMGVGWNLNATASIERCNRTPDQDGNASAVDLTLNDRFCMGGNRLRLASGTYGASGSVYYTEIADYSRITASGTAGNGPDHFIVEAKDGLKYEYGNVASSRVALGTTVLRWMLNKVYDRNGNNYVISYNNATGFAVPDVISWAPTSLGAGTYQYQAKFNYTTTRTDKDSYIGKVASNDVRNSNRLDTIQINSAGTVIRKYWFDYGTSGVTSRSLLSSAQECADDSNLRSNCFLPIGFTYQAGMAGVTAGVGAPPTGSSNGLVPGRYDFNGDGKDDIAYLSGGVCYVAFGANTGFSGPYNVGTAGCGVIDHFMPNGRDAVGVTITGTRWIYRWDDATSAFVGVNTGVGGGETTAADYNGDGLADFVSYTSGQLWVRRNTSTSASSNPSFASSAFLAATLPATAFGGTPSFSGLTTYYGNGLQRADLNGDGRQEIFALVTVSLGVGGATPYSMVLQASSSGYTVPPTSAWTGPVPTFSINFNGDSCTDRVLGSTVYISQCNGIAASTIAAPGSALLVLDWDGDGKSDILVNSGGVFAVYLSTGTGFSGPLPTSIPSTGTFYALDQDGDHQEDVIKVNGTSPISYWTHTSGGYVPTFFATNIPDLLSSATDGFGVSFSPSYVSTAWGGSYDKGAATPLPLQEADPQIVTAQVASSDGIGGSYNKTYFYVGGRVNPLRGTESVGFQRFDETDVRNGLIRRLYFSQTFPTSGMVSQRELMQPNGTTTISRDVVTNAFATLDGTSNNQRYFPYAQSVTSTQYEVGGTYDGNLLKTVTTANLFETTGGTLYDQTVTTTEPSSGANGVNAGGQWISRTYLPVANLLNDPANWCLGRPQLVQQINSNNLAYPTAITRTTNLTWNTAYCRPTQIVDESGSGTIELTTSIGYDGFGNVNSTAVSGVGLPTARITSAVYSDATHTTGQFPLTNTNALSQSSSVSWDYNLGVPLSATDPNGVTTSWQYDVYGRQIQETRPDGTYTVWDRASCSGCDARVKLALNSHDYTGSGSLIKHGSQFFDQFERSIYEYNQAMSGSMAVTQRVFDSLGRVSREYFPYWSTSSDFGYTSITYDLASRPVTVSRPISETVGTAQTTNISYLGLTTVVTDSQSKQSTKIVSALGLIARSQDNDNYYQSFDYDAFGDLMRVLDSAGNPLQSSTYNVRGMLTSRTDMDMGTWSFTPDALGETLSQTDAKSQGTTFTFDALGRPATRTEAEGLSTWTWGTSSASKNIGSLASVSGPGYSESYTYDSLGRRSSTSVSADTSYQIDYAYNTQGTLDSLTYPTSTSSYRLKLKYSYLHGQVSQIKDFAAPTTVFWTANTDNPRQQLTQETLGNGLVTSRAFDGVTGWLKSIQTGLSGGSAVQNLAYTWDQSGNLASRKDVNQSNLTESFTYDNLYRLDQSFLNGVKNQDLDYDTLGNITNKLDVGAYTYHSTKKHQVVSTGTPTSWSFGYDNNGNMISGRGSTISWTSYNYPLCITTGSTCTGSTTNYSQFSYTPDRQYWKQVSNYMSGGSATTIYVAGLLEKVTTSSGTDYRHMISAGGSTIIVSRQSTGTNSTYYVTSDHLGSSSAITNSSGAVLVNSSFAAFGQRRGSNWTGGPSSGDWSNIASTTRRGFTDHSMLDNLGLIHMNGRVQDPMLGRFISADPFISEPGNTQNFNRYTYTYNSPLSATDPSGFNSLYNPGSNRFPEYHTTFPSENWGGSGQGTTAPRGTEMMGGIQVSGASYDSGMGGSGTFNPQGPISPDGEMLGWLACSRPELSPKPYYIESTGCIGDCRSTARKARDFYYEINPPAAIVAKSIGDAIAIFRSDGLNPLTSEYLSGDKLQDAKFFTFIGVAGGPLGEELSAARATGAEVGAARAAPNFVVAPNGQSIRVPAGATGPTATRAPGVQYTGGAGGNGLDSRVTGVRIMEGNANQGPRAVYMNRSGQTVDPATGRTVPNADPNAHHYLEPWK